MRDEASSTHLHRPFTKCPLWTRSCVHTQEMRRSIGVVTTTAGNVIFCLLKNGSSGPGVEQPRGGGTDTIENSYRGAKLRWLCSLLYSTLAPGWTLVLHQSYSPVTAGAVDAVQSLPLIWSKWGARRWRQQVVHCGIRTSTP